MPLENYAQHQIWVERLGFDYDGYAAQPDLYIHCALGRHETLEPLAEQIGPYSLLFDLPGHGRSHTWDGRGDYQTEAAAIAAAAIQSEGPCHLIGHSFGATVALRVAVERPECVRRLTLIEPVFFAAAASSAPDLEYEAYNTALTVAFQSGDMARAAEVFHLFWGEGRWDRVRRVNREAIIAQMPLIAATAPAIVGDNAGLLLPDVLENISCPVTFIRGSRSPSIIIEIHKQLMALLPSTSEQVIKGAGHMCPITHTADVAAIIEAESQLLLDQSQKLIDARFGH